MEAEEETTTTLAEDLAIEVALEEGAGAGRAGLAALESVLMGAFEVLGSTGMRADTGAAVQFEIGRAGALGSSKDL